MLRSQFLIKITLQKEYPDKSASEIGEIAAAEIGELERTPPVPWLTQNEWPVAHGDFAQYQYPMGKYLFFGGIDELFVAQSLDPKVIKRVWGN